MEKAQTVYKKTTCPLDCPDTCGIIVEVVDNRIVSLKGDPEHPFTKGVLCKKMRGYHKRVYSEDRVLHPLKRVGTKGNGQFETISWDEAFDILCKKITEVEKKFGGESILPFSYAGNMGAVNRYAGYPLFHKLGATRLEETICSAAASAGWKIGATDIAGAPPEKAKESDLIIIWGSNTKVTNLHFWSMAKAAQKKGAKIVVIDPYKNLTAQSADVYLQVKPSGDGALALGLLKRLIEENTIDNHFIENYTKGFVEFKKIISGLQEDKCFSISGIKQEDFETFLRLIAQSKKIFLRIGMGMTRNSKAAMNISAITSLAASLGLFDGGEGRGVLLTSGGFKGDKEKLVHASLASRESRLFNMVQLGNALHATSPPVKIFFVYNANPLSVTPDGSLVRKALMREDLFTVVHEQVMTPTAYYADLVLPATTFLENSDVHTPYGHFYMSVTKPVIEPFGEAKSNFDFFQELAGRLGFGDDAFKQTLNERLYAYVESIEGMPEEIDFSSIKSGEPISSTRCKLSGSQMNEGQLYDFTACNYHREGEFPCLQQTVEFDGPDYIARYPLKLITPPHMDLLNSTFGERYEGELGEVLIHPRDGEIYHIEDGETVTLMNDRGWCRRIAKITEDTQVGLLVAEGLFWQSSTTTAALNDLTSQKLTDLGGGGTFHESRVALFKK